MRPSPGCARPPTTSGLSPLARGNRDFFHASGASGGPIPAGAGQPAPAPRSFRADWAYPRWRGATVPMPSALQGIKGLSPLARGNPVRPVVELVHHGPIPAGAGQPAPRLESSASLGAYPRWRGATTSLILARQVGRGLSPLARGNLTQHPQLIHANGPIPAGAGQPGWSGWIGCASRAYPRWRGATLMRRRTYAFTAGLSPLARGNRIQTDRGPSASGPIPAGAGQPRWRALGAPDCWAYPRWRGATRSTRASKRRVRGLSPLARGNPWRTRRRGTRCGPIPAGAGQPRARGGHRTATRAYPRWRGATWYSGKVGQLVPGLSPLARGNLVQRQGGPARAGPIPAGAGQPCGALVSKRPSGAYPRWRGATMTISPDECVPRGLSPLARGNRSQPMRRVRRAGPIPAGAGQPLPSPRPNNPLGAYPRWRGATRRTCWPLSYPLGLSPLARGNRQAGDTASAAAGPIPAGAGQPWRGLS